MQMCTTLTPELFYVLSVKHYPQLDMLLILKQGPVLIPAAKIAKQLM